MRADIRDAVNLLNRFIQENRFIDVSDNTNNLVARTFENKDKEFIDEVLEHMNLIMKEISKLHNEGKENQYLERYYYLSSKTYTDMDEFRRDFFIPEKNI